jgi:hypothetical protein
MSADTITLDPYTFTQQDARRTLGNLGGLWSTMMEGRTSPTAAALGDALAARLAAALHAPAGTPLGTLGHAAAKDLAGHPALREVLADAWATLRAASDALRADGQMPPSAHGIVTQLSTSKGGVPKRPVDAVDVDHRGVVGDVQRVRAHHGRPWQALCLFADEVIDLFRSEGHPIEPGSVGENVTVRGLPWADVRPGVRLQVGTVLAHVQAFAEPCATNIAFFRDGDFHRMNINRGPVSRVYATVLEPGRIATGDTIVLEP